MIKFGNTTAYSVEEVAEIFGVQPDAIRKKIRRGGLPAEKLGGRWLILEEYVIDKITPKNQKEDKPVNE